MDILPQLIANSLIAGSLYTILALGFNLIFGVAKFIDIGYGILPVAAGYSVLFLSKMLEIPLYASIPAALCMSAALSYSAYAIVYRPLRARKATSAVLLIASLGVITTLSAVIAILFSSQFQTLSGLLAADRVLNIAGSAITAVQLSMLGSVSAIFIGLALLLKKTMFGKAVSAISDDEEVSQIVGINTKRIIGVVFLIAGAIGGAAGILIGFDTGIEPTVGLFWLLSGVTAAIIGGIGNVYGSPAGGYLLAFAENFGIWQIAGEWKSAITFGLLILFLLWKPKGLFPR